MKSGSNDLGWTAAGAVVRGALHIRQDKPCQDALYIPKTADGFTLACVADGHGSASCPYSDEGAREAVRLAAKLFMDIMEQGIHDAHSTLTACKDIRLPKQIEAMWYRLTETLHENKGRGEVYSSTLYGTTLLAALATDEFLFALQIGDGDIMLIDTDGVARHVFPDYVNIGEDTESLCMKDSWQYIKTALIPWDVSGGSPMVMLSTDGYANSFIDGAGLLKAGADFYEIWQGNGLEHINENLPDWLRESSDKGSGDDISLALIVRNT